MVTVVVLAWVVFYAVAFATAEHPPTAVTAVAQLVVPPLLGVALLQIGSVVVAAWRARAGFGSRTSTLDPAGRLLAAAVAALPAGRRDWGRAMIAELAEVRGPSARWRFALSCARATLWLPPAGGWLTLALVTGVVVSAVAAVGPAVGAAVPGLTVFAATFTGLVGAMVVVAVARASRPRLTLPAPTVLVVVGVAASIAMTVVFLLREPAAARHLPPAATGYLALVLAGCLALAVSFPRSLGTDRRGPHLAAFGAVVFAAWFLLAFGTDGAEPPIPVVVLLGAVLVITPAAAFFVPAFVAGRRNRSFRSGLRATVWTVIAAMPLAYALWLPEALRRHAIDGRTLDGELIAPVGVNLTDALTFSFGIFPVLGLTVGLVGAALGARLVIGRAAPGG
jgi:hypothetical protein